MLSNFTMLTNSSSLCLSRNYTRMAFCYDGEIYTSLKPDLKAEGVDWAHVLFQRLT